MANPNITPRPENLTRAGMGQPKKGYKPKLVTLPPELIDRIQAIADSRKVKFNAVLIAAMTDYCDLDLD